MQEEKGQQKQSPIPQKMQAVIAEIPTADGPGVGRCSLRAKGSMLGIQGLRLGYPTLKRYCCNPLQTGGGFQEQVNAKR